MWIGTVEGLSVYYPNGAPVSIANPDSPNHLTIYPNPTSDLLQIQLSNAFTTGASLQITIKDMAGRAVLNKSFTNHNVIATDISQIAPVLMSFSPQSKT